MAMMVQPIKMLKPFIPRLGFIPTLIKMCGVRLRLLSNGAVKAGLSLEAVHQVVALAQVGVALLEEALALLVS